MSTLINKISDGSSSAGSSYPIIPSGDKGKEEAIPEAIEQTDIFPSLQDNDAACMILNYATNGGMDSQTLCRMRRVNSTWLRAIDAWFIRLCWGQLEKKTQNPSLRDIIYRINTNVSLINTTTFINLFVDDVINSALSSSFGEGEPSEGVSLSTTVQSLGPSYFSRFSDLTSELRKSGAPIRREHAILGLDHYLYEEMQQRLDSSLEAIWRQLRENYTFKIFSVPESALEIRERLNDSEKVKEMQRLYWSSAYGYSSGHYGLPFKLSYLTVLPREIGVLISIVGKDEVDLTKNKFQCLPESFGNLNYLDGLTLNALYRLRRLDFQSNLLQSIPESFGNFASLRKLNLSWNLLQSLPESFGNLSNLVELELNNNQLHSLPESFGNLSNLVKLDLSDNELQNLPKRFDNLSRLEELRMFNNPFLSILARDFYGLELPYIDLDRMDRNTVRDLLHNSKRITKSLTCLGYACSSPLATLCQKIHLEVGSDALRKAFGELSEAMQQRISQQWLAIPSSSGPSSEANGDLLTDRTSFIKAVAITMQDKLDSLSQEQRNQAYFHVWDLAGQPLDGDLKWGEHHFADNIFRAIDAMEYVIPE